MLHNTAFSDKKRPKMGGMYKTWFNQPARKRRRRAARMLKAQAVFPRPASGLLRPVVQCCTQRHNMRFRAGYGFTHEELRAAAINPKAARSIGIAVDSRRANLSEEGFRRNVARLEEYKSKLVLFPRGGAKLGLEAAPERLDTASQLHGDVLPVRLAAPRVTVSAVSDEMKALRAFSTLRQLRAEKRLIGKMDKKDDDE